MMVTDLVARGQWVESAPYSTEGKWDVNYSSILTQLIQSAGKYCKRYASDLFIDWEFIVDKLKAGEDMYEQHIFAFRDNGVDHEAFYKARQHTYHEVWELSIEAHDREIVMFLSLLEN